jgi:hypothetical protein
MGHDLPGRAGVRRVAGDVGGEERRVDQGLPRTVDAEIANGVLGPGDPVGVFRVPCGDARVGLGDVEQRQHARGPGHARRIALEVAQDDLIPDARRQRRAFIARPELRRGGLLRGEVVLGVGDRLGLGAVLGAVVLGERPRVELAAGLHHPRRPRARERSDGGGEGAGRRLPGPALARRLARPLAVRAVLLGLGDDLVGDRMTEVHPRPHVAGKARAGLGARASDAISIQ